MNYLKKSISGYTITRLIGSGGIAEVYEGVSSSGRRVALKILLDKYQADQELRKRFNREAEIMQRLNHPNIVKVLPIDPSLRASVIIMELLKGRDLKQFITSEGNISLNAALSFFVQVANALEHSHSLGILHRDIKPSNIFVTREMHVKVLDFGIAKAGGEVYDKTRTGVRMGSPAFMSPEQVKAINDPDPRSDIYSLGVTLYCMLTGVQPYDGIQSEYEIFSKIMNEPLPKIEAYPHLSEVVAKATAKSREDRFTDAGSFREAFLEAYAKTIDSSNNGKTGDAGFTTPTEQYPNTKSTTSKKRDRGWLITTTLFAVMLIGAVLGYDQYGKDLMIEYKNIHWKSNTYDGYTYFDIWELGYIPHGIGTINLIDGSKFTTQWEHGVPNPNGTLTYKNGDIYTGAVDYMNFPNGKGKMVFTDGRIYEGDFKEGKMDGQGKMTWSSQESYEGTFFNNNLHGTGTRRFFVYKIKEGCWVWVSSTVTYENGVKIFEKINRDKNNSK